VRVYRKLGVRSRAELGARMVEFVPAVEEAYHRAGVPYERVPWRTSHPSMRPIALATPQSRRTPSRLRRHAPRARDAVSIAAGSAS
jgi:hypothetical protein